MSTLCTSSRVIHGSFTTYGGVRTVLRKMHFRATWQEAEWRGVRVALTCLGIMLIAAACSSTTQKSAPTASPNALTAMTIGYVPAFNVTALFLGQQQGYFKANGLKLTLDANDSGPALISSTIHGTYQASFVAAFPAMLAYAKGASVKAIAGSGVVAPHEEAEGVFVRSGSNITSLANLAGKTVGTNALTSAVTLGVQGGISAEGGNPKTTRFIALPFPQEIEEVKNGSLDAAALINPYIAQAKSAGLVNIGDPIVKALPDGTPYGIFITSDSTAKEDAGVLKRFVAALAKSDAYTNAHPKQAESAEVADLGIPAAAAKVSPPQRLSTSLSSPLMGALAQLMVKYNYIPKLPNINAFMP